MDIKHLILIAGIVPALSLASCDDNEPDNKVTTDLASIETGYDGNGIWETNIFGKTVEQLVRDGIAGKIAMIGDESQMKLQETMQKIVNDSNGGMVCIII